MAGPQATTPPPQEQNPNSKTEKGADIPNYSPKELPPIDSRSCDLKSFNTDFQNIQNRQLAEFAKAKEKLVGSKEQLDGAKKVLSSEQIKEGDRILSLTSEKDYQSALNSIMDDTNKRDLPLAGYVTAYKIFENRREILEIHRAKLNILGDYYSAVAIRNLKAIGTGSCAQGGIDDLVEKQGKTFELRNK
jgi:hypothetical protein